ncbi:efflux RND transporter periplasmic adaptor subunit [Haloimpatiens sp. FM7315]|uniref:efflux RND transporter periplasmic adaptor subunit n=1 Tax=Haloimpatiens sp. FM7315 TaxID=3298609 RepID=UPI003977C86D
MKKKIFFWAIPILILGAILGVSIINKEKGKFQEVKVEKAVKGELKEYLSTNGKIESKESKEYFGIQGKVKKVNVKVGQNIKKGEVLVVYYALDLASNVKQAQLQYSNALLQNRELISQRQEILNNKKEIDESIKALEKSSNPQDLLKIQSLKEKKASLINISDEKIKQSENSVELAKIAVDVAKENLKNSKSQIVAESDGVVTSLNVKEGAMDSGAQPLLEVQNIKDLQVVISLNKYDVSKVKLGQKVLINSGNSEYKGKISFIDPIAKEVISGAGKETSLKVKADILDKTENLKIGFDVDLDILVSETKNALKIPSEAIKIDKKGSSYVYLVKNGKTAERKIKVGIQSDLETEILEGLKLSEKVILNPKESIKNGTLVKESLEEK